jgi:hypothetical protein
LEKRFSNFVGRPVQLLPGSGEWGRREELPQTMHTHVNKCKNDKRKKKSGKHLPSKYETQVQTLLLTNNKQISLIGRLMARGQPRQKV